MRHRVVLAVAIVTAGLAVSASQQPLTPQAIAERAARFKQQSIDAEAKGLSEPFKGVTTNRDGHAVGDRAVGLAVRRPPRDHQLLRAGRPGGDDPVLLPALSR